jgi:hypothetical protein
VWPCGQGGAVQVVQGLCFSYFGSFFPKFTTTTSTSENFHPRYKNANVYNKQDFSPAVQSMSQVLANPRSLFQGLCNDSTACKCTPNIISNAKIISKCVSKLLRQCKSILGTKPRDISHRDKIQGHTYHFITLDHGTDDKDHACVVCFCELLPSRVMSIE